MKPDRAQLKAIMHKEGPCMVLAGPGAGKTFAITQRIRYLIQEADVKAQEILVLTYTKAAAKEMKERFNSICGNQSYPVTFGTFHSVYYHILETSGILSKDNLFMDNEKYMFFKEILSEEQISYSDEKEFIQDFFSDISYVKNNQISKVEFCPKSCEKEEFEALFTKYEMKRKQYKKVDFDDILVIMRNRFVKYPELLQKWQKAYTYILVDEFQDINRVQYEVLKMLAEPKKNLFIVGDDDQSIYGFRGATPQIMQEYAKDYPSMEQVQLAVNYRSTKNIVNGTVRLIKNNTLRYKKKIRAGADKKGKPLQICGFKSIEDENTFLAEKINEEIKNGSAPNEIALLFRTSRDAGNFAAFCNIKNIKYYSKDILPTIYEHFIARNICAYMSMATQTITRSNFLEVMNKPSRYIGRDALKSDEINLDELQLFYQDKPWIEKRIVQLKRDLRMIGRMTPYAAIRYIREKIGYEKYLEEYAQKYYVELKELLEILEEVESLSKNYYSIEEWVHHVEEERLAFREKKKEQQPDKEAIILSTMHGAKGLEYETVFLPKVNEGTMPYKKAVADKEQEEERRLFYVAMTRARKKLYITYAKKNERGQGRSRFLEELF